MTRFGIVYIAASTLSHGPRFTGYWNRGDPPELLEQGPGWDEVEEAVAWARARAHKVVLRLGATEDSIYSAGDVSLSRFADGHGARYPEWPPRAG